jgi:predicted DsbA family dithiol-disulfide isomerase
VQHRLVVYADYACPFCYLAEQGAARLKREGGIVVAGAAFELRPAGTPLPAPDAAWMRASWERHIEPLAAELNVAMRLPSLVTRTRKAHEAAAYARSQGQYEAMHEALYRAYWQDDRDIGRIDVLAQIGAGVGLDATAVRVALDIDQWADHVAAEREQGVALGLRGVPAYVLLDAQAPDMQAVDMKVGLLRYEELRAWVETRS